MSINANELRIGNWVQYEPFDNSDEVKIGDGKYQCSAYGIYCITIDVKYARCFYPIPISEDVLMACGFEKYKYKEHAFEFNSGILLLGGEENEHDGWEYLVDTSHEGTVQMIKNTTYPLHEMYLQGTPIHHGHFLRHLKVISPD